MDILEKYKNQYNVHDFLKEKTLEEIREYCQERAAPAAMAMFNTDYDFNISAIWRICNCFNLRELYHIQSEGKRVDKRACQGANHYTPMVHCYNENEFFDKIQGKYTPVAFEVNMKFPSIDLHGFVPAENSIFIFGAENQGLSDSVLEKCSKVVSIKNFGALRSLNVGITAGIAANHYRMFWR